MSANYIRHPGTSDIDFVAVTDRAPDAADVAALERVHMQLRGRWPKTYFDGSYITWEDLARDPVLAGRRPCSHEGLFDPTGTGCCANPVTWHTIAYYGIAWRGGKPSEVNIWADRSVLANWTLSNIDTYWRRLLDRASRGITKWSLAAYSHYGAVWIVLGITRLHYTLATGGIASKVGAGRYALRVFPEYWRRIVMESLRLREADYARTDVKSVLTDLRHFLPFPWQGRSLYRTPMTRRRDVLAYGKMVIADCHRLNVNGVTSDIVPGGSRQSATEPTK